MNPEQRRKFLIEILDEKIENQNQRQLIGKTDKDHRSSLCERYDSLKNWECERARLKKIAEGNSCGDPNDDLGQKKP